MLISLVLKEPAFFSISCLLLISTVKWDFSSSVCSQNPESCCIHSSGSVKNLVWQNKLLKGSFLSILSPTSSPPPPLFHSSSSFFFFGEMICCLKQFTQNRNFKKAVEIFLFLHKRVNSFIWHIREVSSAQPVSFTWSHFTKYYFAGGQCPGSFQGAGSELCSWVTPVVSCGSWRAKQWKHCRRGNNCFQS